MASSGKRGRLEADDRDKTPDRNDPGQSSDDEGPMPMPMPMPATVKKRKVLKFEKVFLDALPSAEMYEKSYMHRDTVSHTLVSPFTEYIITASIDGHVKFWKKMEQGLEFVKHFKAHLGAIQGLACSADGLRLCSTSADQAAKFYDVVNFDMVNMIKLPYVPGCCIWLWSATDHMPKIAIADWNTPTIRIYNSESKSPEPLHVLNIHSAPVCAIAFNSTQKAVISADRKGLLDCWSSEDYQHVKTVKYKYKTDTDLYALAKAKTWATSISCSPDGSNFVVTAKDSQIRVFSFKTGKLRRMYDESIAVFEDGQQDGSLKLDPIDFGRRMAVERELQASENAPPSNALFDETGNFLIYSTLLGIKIVNIVSNTTCRILGKVENTERFLHLSLYQGIPNIGSQWRSKSSKKHRSLDGPIGPEADPMLFCTAFKRNRFFCFSSREPEGEDEEGTGRDVFNEKPTREESEVHADTSSKLALGKQAVLRTTMGDIYLKLFPTECPKTVENFSTHARNGYYDGVLFHRVIKSFMLQTGDPLGDGTGGESIWGGEFEDEFHRNLRHDRPYTLSMANAGPNTNGSQFFITTVPTPWLDNKHTVFGRVERGMDVIHVIENVKTNHLDKPFDDIKIINIEIK